MTQPNHLAAWLSLLPEDIQDDASAVAARFEQLHLPSLLVSPAPKVSLLFRSFRGAAMLMEDGSVRTSELLHIFNAARFLQDSAERERNLGEATWSNLGTLLTPHAPKMMTRSVNSIVDFDGVAITNAVPSLVRHFETLLNIEAALFASVLEGEVATPSNPSCGAMRRLREPFRVTLVEEMGLVVQGLYRAAVAEFRSHLDQEKLDVMNGAGAREVNAYNWLLGLDGARPSAEMGLRRFQAAKAYPLAWSMLAQARGAVRNALEHPRQPPLAPILAEELGVSEGALRRLNGLGIAQCGLDALPTAGAVKEVALRMERMPPGPAPTTAAGWQAYFAMLRLDDVISDIRTASNCQLADHPTDGLLASCAGRWDGMDAHALDEAANGFRDMLREVHDNLLLPAARLGGATWSPADTLLALTRGRSRDQLVGSVRTWHENRQDIRAQMAALFPRAGDGKQEMSWLPISKAAYRFGPTLSIVELVNAAELKDEHVRMKHCVDGYVPACMYQSCHILSVRKNGRSIATAQIQENALRAMVDAGALPDVPLTTLPPAVVQFKGVSNAMPEQEAWGVLWDLMGEFSNGRHKIDWASLESGRALRREESATGRSLRSYYDARTEEAVGACWKAHGFLFSKSVLKRGPAELVTAVLSMQGEARQQPGQEIEALPDNRPLAA